MKLCCLWVVLAVMLSACNRTAVTPAQTTDSVPEQAATLPDTAGQPPPAGEPEQLTASLLYDVLLGEIAGQRGRMDVSAASYLQAAKQSDDPRIAARALKIAAYAKQPKMALEAARRWVKLTPDSTEARQMLAMLALRDNQQQEAIKQFEYLVQHSKAGNGSPYQTMLALLAREPDRARALRVMAQLTALRPSDPEAHFAYARLAVHAENWPLARKQYRHLLKKQPDNGQVVYSLALLLLESGELKESGKLFKKLVKLNFQPQQAYYYLGAIAEEQKHPARAMQWYRKVGKGDHWIEVQIRMARLEAQDNDVDAARERLRRLRLAHPAQAQRLFLVEGEILAGIDWYDEAFRLYSEYLETRPDDLEILYARSLVAVQLDRLDQAESDLRAVLKHEPDNTRALNALGYTLADRTDRLEEALTYIQKAYDQTPEDPAVIDSMGWVLYRLGRLQEARDHLQKAYDMTGDVEIAAHLGEVLWQMGEKDAARALWNKARKASPGDPVLEETVRRLSP